MLRIKLAFILLFILVILGVFFYSKKSFACDPAGGYRCGDSQCCTDNNNYSGCSAQPRTCTPIGGGGSCSGPAPACDAKFACGGLYSAQYASPQCVAGQWACVCSGSPGGNNSPTPTPGGQGPSCNPVAGAATGLTPYGTLTAGAYTLSWTAGANASYHLVYVTDLNTNTNIVNGAQVNMPTVSYGPVTLTAGHNYAWTVTAYNSCSGAPTGQVSITAVAAPNCKNVTGPAVVLTGDTVSYNATSENGGGTVTSTQMSSILSGASCTPQPVPFQTQNGGAGTYSFNWTPSAAGNYELYCTANDSISGNSCLGLCTGSSPPQYNCVGTGGGATTSIPVTVQDPSSWWYKVKDGSLDKIGYQNLAVLSTVNKFTATDPDDNTIRALITSSTGNEGIGVLDSTYNGGTYGNYPDIPISKTSGWVADTYTASPPLFITNYWDYVKSRKNYHVVTNFPNDITSNAVNVIESDTQVVIDSTNAGTIASKGPFVLVVRNAADTAYGTIKIDVDHFNDNAGTPISSIAIMAKDIEFSPNVMYADGIFIANDSANAVTVDAGNAGITGLKIKGNLISNTAVDLAAREQSDKSKPTLFVVFDPTAYINLLPYVSNTVYEQRINQ